MTVQLKGEDVLKELGLTILKNILPKFLDFRRPVKLCEQK